MYVRYQFKSSSIKSNFVSQVMDPIYGVKEPEFSDYLIAGLILMMTYFSTVFLASLSLIIERKEGLFERSLAAACSNFEIILSHVFAQLIILFVQVASAMIITFVILDNKCQGPIVWVWVLVFLQGTCGMLNGLLVSAMTTDENKAFMIAMSASTGNWVLSGLIWPIESLSPVLRKSVQWLPQTIPNYSMQCLISRGWGIDKPQVYAGFLVTLAWILIFIVGAGIGLKSKK